MTDLYTSLQVHLHTEPDRHGECHITCPKCGKESSTKKPHCSFNEHGYYCFVCGEGFGLSKLAELVHLDSRDYSPQIRKPDPPRKRPDWMANPERYVRQYEAHPRRYELWEEYKPVPIHMIDQKRLGVGVLPEYSSRCRHERLIVPVMVGTMIVGLRARAINCDCGKWMSAAGSINLPLYNADELRYRDVVWIVENPVDALMISQSDTSIGVATYGVSMWNEAWTQLLIDAKPSRVYVAYDNDLPGNGGAWNRQKMIDKWLETHSMVPQANGIRLVNHLLSVGLPAVLYDWRDAQEKSDIGGVMMQNLRSVL